MLRTRLLAATVGVIALAGCVVLPPATAPQVVPPAVPDPTSPVGPTSSSPAAPTDQYAGDLAACNAYITESGEAGAMSIAVITGASGTIGVDVTAADIEATIAQVASYEIGVSAETRYELLSFNEPLFDRSDRLATGSNTPVEADWETLAYNLSIACGTIGL